MFILKFIFSTICFCFFSTSIVFTQFINVKAELDLRRINESDRIIFNNFSNDIENYFSNTQFGSDLDDLELVIHCRLILESISRTNSQNIINAMAIFNNNSDQYYYTKSIQFPYEQGQKLYYTTSFDPLISFMNYYAYIFIGNELDTYEYMGGTGYLNKSIEIANLGKDSDWSNGWDERWKKLRKSKNNQYLRSIRFNFFTAYDSYLSENIDKILIYNSMTIFYEELQNLDKKIGSDKETLNFLKAYNEIIANLFYILEMKDALKLLMIYDHDNKMVYQTKLENRNQAK